MILLKNTPFIRTLNELECIGVLADFVDGRKSKDHYYLRPKGSVK